MTPHFHRSSSSGLAIIYYEGLLSPILEETTQFSFLSLPTQVEEFFETRQAIPKVLNWGFINPKTGSIGAFAVHLWFVTQAGSYSRRYCHCIFIGLGGSFCLWLPPILSKRTCVLGCISRMWFSTFTYFQASPIAFRKYPALSSELAEGRQDRPTTLSLALHSALEIQIFRMTYRAKLDFQNSCLLLEFLEARTPFCQRS